MSYYEEYDPYTGERSSFGGIAEAAAEYHARGEMCPWDCWKCGPESDPEYWAEENRLSEAEAASSLPDEAEAQVIDRERAASPETYDFVPF